MEKQIRWLFRLMVGVFVVTNIAFALGLSSYELKLGFLPLTMAINGAAVGVVTEIKPIKKLNWFIMPLLWVSFAATCGAVYRLPQSAQWWWYFAYSLDYIAIGMIASTHSRVLRPKQITTKLGYHGILYFLVGALQLLAIPWVWLALETSLDPISAFLVESCGVGLAALLIWAWVVYRKEPQFFFPWKKKHAHPTVITTSD